MEILKDIDIVVIHQHNIIISVSVNETLYISLILKQGSTNVTNLFGPPTGNLFFT